jgi:hypothetical protein
MNLTFSSPVDASNYIAGFGVAKGALLLSIDYTSNLYRFQLIAVDGTIASQINGVTGNPADQINAAADIRAAVAATNP